MPNSRFHFRSFVRPFILFTPLIFSLAFLPVTTVKADGIYYNPTYLPSFGGEFIAARAMNNSDQIVGISDVDWSIHHAFLWDKGVMKDLGTLGGGWSEANGINNLGQIVGKAATNQGVDHAVLWDHGMAIDLGVLGGQLSAATSINDLGQIVGYSDVPGASIGQGHATMWDHGQIIDLGTLGTFSYATGINNKGQVVGYSIIRNGVYHAFLWENGHMTDLGTLGIGISSFATAINDNSQIVGYSYTDSWGDWDKIHAFLYANGQMTDLGTTGGTHSIAYAINNKGVIIGDSYDANDHDVLTEWVNGQIIDTNLEGGSVAAVAQFGWYAIDDLGNMAVRNIFYTKLTCDQPTITLNDPINSTYNRNDSFMLSYTMNSVCPIADYNVIVNGSAWGRANNSVISLNSFPSGNNTIEIQATDVLGNVGSKTINFTIAIDSESTIADINQLTAQGKIKNSGIANSLINSIENAKKEFATNPTQAAKDLQNLLKKIESLPDNVITPDAKSILITDINYILANQTY